MMAGNVLNHVLFCLPTQVSLLWDSSLTIVSDSILLIKSHEFRHVLYSLDLRALSPHQKQWATPLSHSARRIVCQDGDVLMTGTDVAPDEDVVVDPTDPTGYIISMKTRTSWWFSKHQPALGQLHVV